MTPADVVNASIANLLKLAAPDMVQEVDGFFVYYPKAGNGALSAWMLRALAAELDRRNAPIEAELDEYCKAHP